MANFIGGGGDDSFEGGAGSDTMAGNGGNDTLIGNGGNDTISGDSGSDSISGGDGADFLDGGLHNDTIDGGIGNDTIVGGEGDDTVYAGEGHDTVDGGLGADLMLGGGGNDSINGGNGNDKIYGGAGSDSLVGGNGADTIEGGAGNDTLIGETGADVYIIRSGGGSDWLQDFRLSDGDKIALEFPGINSFADVQPLMTYDGNDTWINFADGTKLEIDNIHPSAFTASDFMFSAPSVCFAAGTLIATPDGERPVELLAPGDLVMTLDHGPQPIRWTHSREHPLEDPEVDAKPVQIKSGALGRNKPAHDLIVSPQHRLLVGGAGQLHRVFATEAFAPAKSLTSVPGIRHMKGKARVTWVHFACDRHEVVTANGCLSESLLLGPMVVNGLERAERRVLFDLFGPALASDMALNGPPARECLTVGAARRQIAKHRKEKGQPVARKTAKWDRDLAMKEYGAERLAKAASRAQPGKTAIRSHRPRIRVSERS